MDRQFQLLHQLKILQQLTKTPTQTVLTGGGNADALYAKLLQSQQNLQQAGNETQRIKAQIADTEQRIKEEHIAQEKYKQQLQDFNSELRHKKAMKNYNRKMEDLNDKVDIEEINNLAEGEPAQEPAEEPISESEPIEDQIINTRAQKLILEDQIKWYEKELEQNTKIQTQEELAGFLSRQARPSAKYQAIKDNYLQSLKTTNENAKEIQDLMLKLPKIKGLTNSVPLIQEHYDRLNELNKEIPNHHSYKKKLALTTEMIEKQQEIKNEYQKILVPQEQASNAVNKIEQYQTDNGVITNPEYVEKLKQEIQQSTPTKATKIQIKVSEDQKDVENAVSQ